MTGERGSAPIELALGMLVLLVPVALVVLSFGPLLERRNLVRTLATTAARTVVATEGDTSRAVDVLVAGAVAAGVDPDQIRVGFCADPDPVRVVAGDCALHRDTVVEVTVALAADPAWLPGVDRLTVGYTHRQPLDPYRSRP